MEAAAQTFCREESTFTFTSVYMGKEDKQAFFSCKSWPASDRAIFEVFQAKSPKNNSSPIPGPSGIKTGNGCGSL